MGVLMGVGSRQVPALEVPVRVRGALRALRGLLPPGAARRGAAPMLSERRRPSQLRLQRGGGGAGPFIADTSARDQPSSDSNISRAITFAREMLRCVVGRSILGMPAVHTKPPTTSC